ncbi:MAG TPA: PQQ-binding-like beta-propeller repeat protein, partial [Candidatus Avipropionibacterium avicola]|nr:PQQ-binding-like beta-propeller repeat protein [Candidatus Avipropionibacterium avicola]
EQGDDRVLACSRQRLRTSDPATGETLWEIEGHYRDANPQWYGERILISKEEGQVQLLDPGSGETQVEIESGVARLDKAGLVRDGSRVVVTGPGGRVAAVDLDDGSNQVLGQISIDYVYSTPLLEDDLYVVATMGGELRGYRLPPS